LGIRDWVCGRNFLTEDGRGRRCFELVICLGLGLAVAFILAAAFLNAITYVRGWYDDTAYHIPMAVTIARHLNPYTIDAANTPFTSMWFPAGAETLVAALIRATGSIRSSNLSGAFSFALLLALTYAFAGLWARRATGRVASVALVACIPLLLGQTIAFYVDIHLALLVCLSLYLLCRALVTEDSQSAYFGIAAAFLATSVKYHGLIYAGVLLPAAIYCVVRSPRKAPTGKAVAALTASFLFAGGWYVRNWLLRGNPIFPLPVLSFARPLLALVGAPYQELPGYFVTSPETAFPHPFVPAHLLRYVIQPDMTGDGFGLVFVVAGLLTLLTLVFLRRMSPRRRHAWIFLLVVTLALVLVVPFRLAVPRYALFAPVILALAPAVLGSAIAGAGERPKRIGAGYAILAGVNVLVLLVSAWYIYGNIRLHRPPVSPRAIVRYDYVEKGNLRIGYLNGRNGFIAALYDDRLTNTLIPLHYKNYRLDYSQEFERPEDFIAAVAALNLDAIQIFDPDAPGAELLIQHFPDKVKQP